MVRKDNQQLTIFATRGEQPESVHKGIAVVCNSQGDLIHAWGDPSQIIMPRSTLKPLQALPLIETEAAERYKLSDAELTLACASHRGTDDHTVSVKQWLTRLGLSENDLECGAHPPRNEATLHAMIRNGETPSPLHNNCSGKHAGFLTTALHMNEPTKGYIKLEHPCQQRSIQIINEVCDIDVIQFPIGFDGCSFPVVSMPIYNLALGMARFANPESLPKERKHAIEQLQHAIANNPLMIDGPGRFASDIITATKGSILAKSGAEGSFVAIVPQAKLGIAVKIIDGSPRAATVALGWILQQLDLLDQAAQNQLNEHLRPTLTNCNGIIVGHIECEKSYHEFDSRSKQQIAV